MSSFYNVITTLQPTASNQQQAESFAQQYLSAAYPDVDFREGTGIYDTVIRPAGSLFALVEAAINFYFSNYTLQGANNNTPTDFVDAILGNWFSTRQQGTQAVINVNLYFAAQVPVTLTTNQVFSPDGVTTFSPQNSAVYPATMLVYDPARQEWYLNVNLQATATGTQYNLSSGTLLYFTNFNPFFLSGTINYLVSSGLETETNSEFITRTQAEISTRNLINRNSIEAFMSNTFPELTNMSIVGYGDFAMQRDYVTIYSPPASADVGFHMGGYVDIYASTPATSGFQTVTLDASGSGTLGGAIYNITNAGTAAGTTVTVPGTATFATSWPSSIVSAGTIIPSGDVLFSSQQVTQVSFGATYANAVAGLAVSNFQNLTSYQNGVSNPSTRVLCANYLVREPGTYFLDIILNSANPTPYTGNPTTVAQQYISGLAIGQVFSVGDFLNLLQMPGLMLPVTINYTYYGTDGTVVAGSFSDFIPHSTTDGTASGITQFTATADPIPPTGLFQFVLNSVVYSYGVTP